MSSVFLDFCDDWLLRMVQSEHRFKELCTMLEVLEQGWDERAWKAFSEALRATHSIPYNVTTTFLEVVEENLRPKGS